MAHQDENGNWIAEDRSSHSSYLTAKQHERDSKEESYQRRLENSADRSEKLAKIGMNGMDVFIGAAIAIPGLIALTAPNWRVKLLGCGLLVLLGVFIWVASKFSADGRGIFYAALIVTVVGAWFVYK